MNPLTELQTIPGVGASLSESLLELGYTKADDLKGLDPEGIYQDIISLRGEQIDPCVLYVLRGAVYYASNTVHDPELLKWWNWKDRGLLPCRSKQKSKGAEYAQQS